jgi:hypothetical protein
MCITEVALSNWRVSDLKALGQPGTNVRPLGVIITDQEYPVRPAFSLLTKILEEFSSAVPQTSYATPASISFPQIQTYLQKYQDPHQADSIMKVQQELDETKIILVCLNPLMD